MRPTLIPLLPPPSRSTPMHPTLRVTAAPQGLAPWKQPGPPGTPTWRLSRPWSLRVPRRALGLAGAFSKRWGNDGGSTSPSERLGATGGVGGEGRGCCVLGYWGGHRRGRSGETDGTLPFGLKASGPRISLPPALSREMGRGSRGGVIVALVGAVWVSGSGLLPEGLFGSGFGGFWCWDWPCEAGWARQEAHCRRPVASALLDWPLRAALCGTGFR